MVKNKIYGWTKKLNIKICMLLLDALIIAVIPILALLLRLDGDVSGNEHFFEIVQDYLPLVIGVRLAILWLFGLYERVWRHTSIPDLLEIVMAITTGTIVLAIIGFVFEVQLPRSIYPLSWILLVLSIVGLRVFFRVVADLLAKEKAESVTRLLIVGAGDAGSLVAREIRQRSAGLQLVGFVDDAPEKIGGKLLGITIMGPIENIHDIIEAKAAAEVIIAIPSASGEVIKKIFDLCRSANCRVRILPSLYEFIEERGTLQQLRGVDIDDLLRREAVKFDTNEIAEYIAGKSVLVTGAGGSIGSEICRKIALLKPRQILLLGRGENSIYEIHQALLALRPDIRYTALIVDISDRQAVFEIFKQYKPQIVFHAAAHKHVPFMENQPHEAMRINVFGTKNLADAACESGVEKFIQISTDKAVNPTSVMGASKRLAEMIIQTKNDCSDTKFVAVRFGNVLGSRGSVLPLFKNQIAAGGPVTITHPDMTRYFMTIPEAAQLVLHAGAMAIGGEVFVLDMGKPVRILDMAKDLIELYGLVPDKDIKIVFSGIRAGEKLFEELLASEENCVKTKHPQILKAKLIELEPEKLMTALGSLQGERSRFKIITTLLDLLPTYQSSSLSRSTDR